MHLLGLIGALLTAVVVSAEPGILLDEPHHTSEVLGYIHNTPSCAYECMFSDDYKKRFAEDCQQYEGLKHGKCLCYSPAYQYIVDQCVSWHCSGGQREIVHYPSCSKANALVSRDEL